MKHLITLIFCFTLLSVNAQKIENVKIDQKTGELLFQYDLNGGIDDLFKVSVMFSTDKKTWNPIDKVYGDIGDSITSGPNKKFVLWIDNLKNVQTEMSFKIVAEYFTVDQKKMGNLKGEDGYMYNWILYGQNKWMTQNLKATKTDSECGGLFNNVTARNACPDGWVLPTDEDWMELEIEFGVSKDKVKEHGLHVINLDKLHNSGFTVEQCSYSTTLYPNQKALAFWTSSENKMLYTGYSDKYFARIIRIDEGKISKELRNKTEKLSVRCVQSAVYLAKIESISDININLNPVSGTVNHPFTGEELEWQYIANNIWLKKDIKGSYVYKETADQCPSGWRLPVREEWESLLKEFSPSIETESEREILNERLSANGVWSFNMTNDDYWMSIDYYTYNTYWINKNDKADSRKLRSFVSNKRALTTWADKQTNEKGKVRCLLDNKDYITQMKDIKTGNFTDSRDNKEYGFVEIDGNTWMSENLNFDFGENSECRDNIKSDCKLFGHMYNIEVVNGGCPDGWKIPSMEEWKYLLINKAANNIKILYPFGGTGFDLLLGGDLIYDEDNKKDVYTANYLFIKDGKPGYYYIDSNGKVELIEKAKKKDFYYVRCIKK
ncbi:MAG: hypothetical protein JEY96_04010 [Bacteroidales bacterium]|nr:hypothetical protein [Bacteroidales bacterium]